MEGARAILEHLQHAVYTAIRMTTTAGLFPLSWYRKYVWLAVILAREPTGHAKAVPTAGRAFYLLGHSHHGHQQRSLPHTIFLSAIWRWRILHTPARFDGSPCHVVHHSTKLSRQLLRACLSGECVAPMTLVTECFGFCVSKRSDISGTVSYTGNGRLNGRSKKHLRELETPQTAYQKIGWQVRASQVPLLPPHHANAGAGLRLSSS